jgi:hypothetical protein
VRARVIGDDLPSKESTHLPKGVRLGVAKCDDVLGVKGDDNVSTIPLKCHQPSRTLYIGGQLKAQVADLLDFLSAIEMIGPRQDTHD